MGALIRHAFLRRKDFGTTQPPQADGTPKVYTFVASDGEFDRYNDRLNVKGWDLKAFNANPVILLNHDTGAGGFFAPPSKTLPIGRGRAYVQGNELLIDIEFDQDDPEAVRVEKKVAGGFMNTGSVRYIMKKYHENDRGGFDSDEQELLEYSIVTLPGNSRAVRLKDALSEGDLDALADLLLPRFAARLKAAVPSSPVADLASALSTELARLTKGN